MAWWLGFGQWRAGAASTRRSAAAAQRRPHAGEPAREPFHLLTSSLLHARERSPSMTGKVV